MRTSATPKVKLLITCEHGGNRIPSKYRALFSKHVALLQSHRGYDPGALSVARDFAAAFGVELVYSTTSRLLVELNRSRGHRQLFSAMTQALHPDERERLLERYYFPYRDWVEAQVREAVEGGGRIVHVSCHSFTPRLEGVERRADVGLLYDPRRTAERKLCLAWQHSLRSIEPRLVVRRNYPYRGYDDGLTTYLRRRHPDPSYSGIELEVNQKYPLGPPQTWRTMRKMLVDSFAPLVH